MSSMLRPGVGFASPAEATSAEAPADEVRLNERLNRVGVEAARRKFTPEFMNRLDKIVVFRALGAEQLRQILEIELTLVQRRVLQSPSGIPFILNISQCARDFLLRTGTDMKYGARHLKRAIERSLVHPISNLMASGQIEGGDLIAVSYEAEADRLVFVKEASEMPEGKMLELLDSVFGIPPMAIGAMPPPQYAVPATARVHRRA
jgi:ATP-dependent Clp protease ATP-binding subunit ClpA